MLNRFNDIEKLDPENKEHLLSVVDGFSFICHTMQSCGSGEESKKQTLYDLIDTYIRDCKTRKTFANL